MTLLTKATISAHADDIPDEDDVDELANAIETALLAVKVNIEERFPVTIELDL